MGSLAIDPVVPYATHSIWRDMPDNHAHRSDQNSYESSYRSRSTSSSQRNTSQQRHSVTPSSSRPTTSAASEHNPTTPSRAIPRRESVSQATSRETPSQASEPPKSPHLSPSHEAEPAAVLDPGPPSSSEGGQPVNSSSQSSVSSESAIEPAVPSPVTIKIKDLKHIHDFLQDENSPLGSLQSPSQQSGSDARTVAPQYEISGMPITDVIEMVAGLLTKITTTNDRQHDHLHRNIPSSDGASHMSPQTASVLAFHGKNVPSISILSYLSRIHKYCPTTYEVFISLLVYFDRMTEKVNAGLMQSLRESRQRSDGRDSAGSQGSPVVEAQDRIDENDSASTPPSSLPNEMGSDAARRRRANYPREDRAATSTREPLSPPLSDSDPCSLAQFFVVDSFNIHRLVIAAVTCASKYFSDVFYTNSRYAKVCHTPSKLSECQALIRCRSEVYRL